MPPGRAMPVDVTPFRVRFPDEAALPWLAPLLDAYALMDAAMHAAAREERGRTGRAPACGPGCAHCCRQPVPASEAELRGLAWYAAKTLRGPARARVAEALRGLRLQSPCPFLLDGACAVYALRPLACREFVVLGRPCAAREDPTTARPDDMLLPPPAAQRGALRLLLPRGVLSEEKQGLHGEDGEKGENGKAARARALLAASRPLQRADWRKLIRVLAASG
ncbi:protein of unknown function UPF0153 [Desulfovibrio sp. X2]|uniref:YkgJ family cysteine cluster protein n=1 Tax=Desulfovibrio sp. X2 TaxID=941449 RepID=UPI00035876B8|nr:YkgJ family cysteine cluster protein [Desulfovibrio sp. X2]EPR43165.1 protein of unknown function UPF0153 [Desulfovibrio sp. X2]